MRRTDTGFLLKGWVFRAVALSVVWWLLTAGSLLSWMVGIPAIILGLTVTRVLPPLPLFHVRIAGAWRFFSFFLQQSILSGFDVARKAVHPKCLLAPCLIKYRFRVSNGFVRVFFANTISLLPGTLSVDLLDDDVLVHVLDKGYPTLDSLKALEARVAALFGENL